MNTRNIPQKNTSLIMQEQTPVTLSNLIEVKDDISASCEITPRLQINTSNSNLPQSNKAYTDGFWEELPEPGQETLTIIPEFLGLILLNANTVQKDGFLVYVGDKEDCLLAAQNKEKVIVTGNSTVGNRMYLFFQQSHPNFPNFNHRSFARSIVMFRVYVLASLLGWANEELSLFLQTHFEVRWVECLSPQQIKAFIKKINCMLPN